MRKHIHLLSLIFFMQAVLVFCFWVFQKNGNDATAATPLLVVDHNLLDELQITGDDQKLSLVKQEGRWLLTDLFNIPASQTKVQHFLNQLLNHKYSWPIATTKSAAERFKVAMDSFERKIDFIVDEQSSGTLLLGTTPGYKKVHARAADQDNIYQIDFSSFEASVKPEDWVDHTLLHVKQDEVVRLKLNDLELTKSEQEYQLASDNQAKIDQEQAQNLIFKLSHLTFVTALSDQPQKDYLVEDPICEFKLELQNGHSVDYQVMKPQKGDFFVLHSSDYPYYFKVAKPLFEEISKLSQNNLKQKNKEIETDT